MRTRTFLSCEPWFSAEDEGIRITVTLTLVTRSNAKISRKDLEVKHSAKESGGGCYMCYPFRKKDNIWWNSELASLRKKARRAWRKAIKTKQEEDWEAQKLALSFFKKPVRRAKRKSWRSFVESTSSLRQTA